MTKTKYDSDTTEIQTPCGKMYVHTIYNTRGKLHSVMANLGKAGSCAKAQLSAYTEAISVFIRYASSDTTLMALTAAKGHRCIGGHNHSCIDALNEHLLELHLSQKEAIEDE